MPTQKLMNPMRISALLILMAMLTACGTKGPLYLPPPASDAPAATSAPVATPAPADAKKSPASPQ